MFEGSNKKRQVYTIFDVLQPLDLLGQTVGLLSYIGLPEVKGMIVRISSGTFFLYLRSRLIY